MKLRLASLTLLVALLSAFTPVPMRASAAGRNTLKNVPVSGVLEDDRSFEGKLTITEVRYDKAAGLLVSGELKGLVSRANGKGL